jgi:hypothetical protein
MKRVYLRDMDWVTAQAEYDSGLSLRGLAKKMGFCDSSVARAQAAGLLKTRSISTAMKLSLSLKPRDYSEARSKRSALTNYRADCRFKFDLKQYPNEFDFDLIREHGWYSPANKMNNLYGVSRDHMVSVRYGFDNGIDAKLISHPANCRLMLHSQNVAKYSECSITIEDLKERILTWDQKYLGM